MGKPKPNPVPISRLLFTIESVGFLPLAKKIAKEFHVTLEQMLSRTRLRHVVHARASFVMELRKLGMSHQAIGNLMGMHHTGIMYLIKREGAYLANRKEVFDE